VSYEYIHIYIGMNNMQTIC